VSDPEAYRYLDKTRELGIKNVHLHKGPTIWPLDRDAFDVEDVDKAATDFPELNFIVEHAGVPRIEQFAYIAVQEPNVYAGLSVVIGAHMYARPNTFARFMGELLFWVGEDRIVFGSDYGIWEPKWQVEGFIDWQMPDGEQFSDYPKLTTTAKKKIMGLNAAKLYDIEVPAECQIPAPGTNGGRGQGSRRGAVHRRRHGRGGAGVRELASSPSRARGVDEPQRGGRYERCPPGRGLGGAGGPCATPSSTSRSRISSSCRRARSQSTASRRCCASAPPSSARPTSPG
jgi:hypothetical protein